MSRVTCVVAAAVALTTVAVSGQQQSAASLRAWLDTHAATRFSGAVLIARGGTADLTAAFGLADRKANRPNTVDTVFNIGSTNKTFTAVAIAQLVQQGRLSFTDTLAKVLPDYPNPDAAAKITIHQLLTHRSGVAPFSSTRFGPVAARRSLAELVRIVAAEPPAFEPGARQEYSNGGYVVLGRVVEVASGRSYDDYVAEHIYRAAGMTSTGFFTPADPARALAIGYFAAGPDGRPVMGPGGRRGGVDASAPTSPPYLRENSEFLDVGNAAGGGYSTIGDLFRFADALRRGKLLDARMTEYLLNGTFSAAAEPKFGYALREQVVGSRRFVGNGGGAPGVNAEFRIETTGDTVVVVLANTSPPSATELLNDILGELSARVP